LFGFTFIVIYVRNGDGQLPFDIEYYASYHRCLETSATNHSNG